uniref:Uncharacterized protein n=1 Tax=Hordeum vulgare subsp. vulgare TaxID=112509 RepID=A0A8I6YR68_HORVV
MAEVSETAGGEPDRRATVLAQHWFRPEVVTHLPSEEAEGFSPCSSPEEGGNARNGQGCSIELVDDFSALDGEVGKRLNDMLPIPVSSHYALHFLLIQDYMSIMTEQLLLVEFIHCIIKGLSAVVLGFYGFKGIQSSTSDRYLI